MVEAPPICEICGAHLKEDALDAAEALAMSIAIATRDLATMRDLLHPEGFCRAFQS
jgi:hypothetical protein